MSMYIVDSRDLVDVADAIRTKGGTSASLEFPDGFVDAIEDISGGGEFKPYAETREFSASTSGERELTEEEYNLFYNAETAVIIARVSESGHNYSLFSTSVTRTATTFTINFVSKKLMNSALSNMRLASEINKSTHSSKYKDSSFGSLAKVKYEFYSLETIL